MDAVINNLEKILDDENGFFIKIRFLDGCDQEKLNDILLALNEVKLFYAETEMIPKYLARLLMDFEPALWIMVDSYTGAKKDEILAAIVKLSTAIQDCFS